jgi:tetratricopeptide (TPR) repeat protein
MVLILCLVCCAPVWALTLKLKNDAREFRVESVSLDGDNVTYVRGRREFTVPLQDFEPLSVYRIRASLAQDHDDWMVAGRYALSRSLYEQAVEAAGHAKSAAGEGSPDAQQLLDTARELHAHALVEAASDLLHEQEPAKAREKLEQVRRDYADTGSAVKADVLLSTVTRVELDLRARELERAAIEAQAEADADESRRRQPVDEWLAEFGRQIERANELRIQGETEVAGNRPTRAAGHYSEAANILRNVRRSLADGRRHLVYRGQNEVADEVEERATEALVNVYERWANYLFYAQLYDQAVDICNRGLRLAPGDRRLLTLKVDLDEARHGMNR